MGTPTFFVIMEVPQKRQQLLLIPPKDALDLWGFLGIRNENLYKRRSTGHIESNRYKKDLEHMERFELDVLALIS
jgi:hypothetical protein